MGFSISTHNMQALRNYTQADNYFNSTRQPRGRKWAAHTRPLRDTRSTHLALVKGQHLGVECYDLVLYDTPMVRYFKPNEHGEQAVWLQYHYSTSSRKFLWSHGWYVGMEIKDTEGNDAKIMFANDLSLSNHLFGDNFTARLVFDSNHKLIRDKSVHMPAFRKSSTATMRARRKALKQKLDVAFAIIEMQYDDMLASAEYDIWNGRPFDSKYDSFPQMHIVRKAVQMIEKGGDPSDDERTHMINYMRRAAGQAIENTINRRLYDSDEVIDRAYWHRRQRVDFPERGSFRDLPDDLREMATPSQEDVRKSVTNRMVAMAGLNADQRVPVPMFDTAVPKTYYGSGLRLTDDLAAAFGPETYCKLTSRKGVVY